MRRLLLALPALSLASTTAAAGAAGEWVQFAREEGVSGFYRSVPGSRVLELRSVVVVDARIEVVGEVLRDVEGLARPGSACKVARLLDRPDRDHYTFYVAYELPGPFNDRVAVVEVANRYDLERGRVIADLRAAAAPPPSPPRDAVRISEFEAQFVVEFLSRERTGVVYTNRIDPGGNVPAFLADYAAREGLLENARVLRAAVRKPEYRTAAAASPDGALAERLVADPSVVRRLVEGRLGELIPDRALAARLAADPAIVDSFVHGDGEVGAVLLLGWGSPASRREALGLLLRRFLDARAVGRAGAVVSRALVDRILSGQGGDAEVAILLAEAGPR